jgi:hypothetical protein
MVGDPEVPPVPVTAEVALAPLAAIVIAVEAESPMLFPVPTMV